MARPRKPIELLQAEGRKHLTKAEIAERKATEVRPCPDGIKAPTYLTQAQKTIFNRIAGQLARLEIMGETDTDTLARYVCAQTIYETLTKELRVLLQNAPSPEEYDYLERLGKWTAAQESLSRQQNRYFQQAHTCATALGLTISSRCKLVLPKREEEIRVNKFAIFDGGGDVE